MTAGFRESVLLREKLMSTEVGREFVIPHGDAKEVKKSCIAFVELLQPVRWPRENANFVIMLCIAGNDMDRAKYVFRNLYRQLDKPEFLTGLRSGAQQAEYLGKRLMLD